MDYSDYKDENGEFIPFELVPEGEDWRYHLKIFSESADSFVKYFLDSEE